MLEISEHSCSKKNMHPRNLFRARNCSHTRKCEEKLKFEKCFIFQSRKCVWGSKMTSNSKIILNLENDFWSSKICQDQIQKNSMLEIVFAILEKVWSSKIRMLTRKFYNTNLKTTNLTSKLENKYWTRKLLNNTRNYHKTDSKM